MSSETINKFGREVGFYQRKRRLTPWRLATSLMMSSAIQHIETLGDAQRAYNALFGTAVAYQPFHKRLAKARFADFMREVAGQFQPHAG